jgi:hypothetical protein
MVRQYGLHQDNACSEGKKGGKKVKVGGKLVKGLVKGLVISETLKVIL